MSHSEAGRSDRTLDSATRRILAIGLCITILIPVTRAQQALQPDPVHQDSTGIATQTVPGLFDAHDLLELTLKANFDTIFKDRGNDRTYHPATLTFLAEESSFVSLDIKIKTRGKTRLRTGNCDFPPLRLNFKKKQVEHTLFANQDKLKLVTHCRTQRQAYEQYLLQEYLAYRVYNLLTDMSFRVRLARITYQDSAGRREPVTRLAFLIEDQEAMVKRNGAISMEGKKAHQKWMDAEHMVLLAVYQYMIGNTDWSVAGLHNIKLIQQVSGIPSPIAVPYDFDYAGVVNAPYAIPAAELGMENVRERLYRGFCRPEVKWPPIFALFNQQREAIYALYQNQPLLDEKQIKSTLEYFDEFYKIINNPRKVKWEILRVCR